MYILMVFWYMIGYNLAFVNLQVEPLDQKRLVAFINQFLTTTVSFLNHFSRACEERLESIHYKICKIEDQLAILESKLSSCSESNTSNDNTNNSNGQAN